MRTLRTDSQIVEVFNSGLVVFVFDEQHRPAIQEADPVVLRGLGTDGEESKDPILKQLAKDGMLLTYELCQDDQLCLELSVGDPLSAKERRGHQASWMRVQKAFLSVPSGKLRVESYDSLTLTPDPNEEGATLEVPPGDYAVAMWRFDFDRFAECTDADWDGPCEVMVLTPTAEVTPPKRPKGFLPYPVTKPTWMGDYQATGSTCRGRSLGGRGGILFTNLDEAAIVELGLCRGVRLEVALDGPFGEKTWEALFLGGLRSSSRQFKVLYPDVEREVLKVGLRDKKRDLCFAEWNDVGELRLLRMVMASPESEAFDGIDENQPITVQVLPEPFHSPPDPKVTGAWECVDAELHGRILVAHEQGWVTNLPGDAIGMLDAVPGEELELVVDGARHHLRHCGDDCQLVGTYGEDALLASEVQQEIDAITAEFVGKQARLFGLMEGDPGHEELSREVAELREHMDSTRIAAWVRQGIPLAGVWCQHWDTGEQVYEAVPLPKIPLSANHPPGTQVTLRRHRGQG